MSSESGSMLDSILEHKRRELFRQAQITTLDVLRQQVMVAPPTRGFTSALQRWPAIIAEIKRRSPSRGEFRTGMDILQQARSYEHGGAAAISVLTDQRYFGMLASELKLVRGAVTLPLLRKDFVLDEYGVFESRVLGADAVLLIVCALTPPALNRLHSRAHELGMEVLVEVHDEAELATALEVGATLIGVNSRNLRTFTTDLEVVERLAPLVPPGVTVVAESGLSSHQQLVRIQEYGVNAFLMGETLLTAADPTAKLRELRSSGSPAPGSKGEST